MTPERWHRIEELFHQARERPLGERSEFLDGACDGDPVLRREIDALLEQDQDSLLPGGIQPAAVLMTEVRHGQHEGRTIGTCVLGPLIGVGGMGEVYRAHDSRLGRDVAVKVLPNTLTHQPDRLVRFEREARILAALSHPNIAAIYGLEQSGHVQGLILELVEGMTLQETLQRGPLPWREALGLARQITDALEAAHEKGIVHRDLKPANIKVTPRGVVKVLDFGLAKIQPDAAGPASLTLLSTQEGVVLGTVAYMSPEQARGHTVDARTDIWAFGCVLYEMLTGVRAFAGDTAADVLGAITHAEPDWTRLPRATPPLVVALIRRCLAKDPAQRFRDIAETRRDVVQAIGHPDRVWHPGSERAPWGVRRRAVVWSVALLLAVSGVGYLAWHQRPGPERSSPLRVSIELPADAGVALASARGPSVAVSPDGRQIAYAAGPDNTDTQLYVRPINVLDSTPLAGTENGTNPVFSADGGSIAFLAGNQLKRIDARGGPVVTIAADVHGGMDWGKDGTIVFPKADGLWRTVGAGPPVRVTTLRQDEGSHVWPSLLPDGRGVVYTIWSNTGFDDARIAVQLFSGGPPTVLMQGGSLGRVARLDDGRALLLYVRPEGVLARQVDLSAMRTIGDAIPVLAGVEMNLSGAAHMSFSPTGLLAYVPGRLTELVKTPLWIDRRGVVTELPVIDGLGFQYRLSRDGRLVRPNAGGRRDLWIDDLRGDAIRSTQLTFDGVHNVPIWTPDGRRVIYAKGLPLPSLVWRAADGSGDEEQLTAAPSRYTPFDVSPDGGTLVFGELTDSADLWLLPLSGARQPREYLRTPAHEGHARLSPDGRWLAYQSNISGRPEVYVSPFPSPTFRVQVSDGGGFSPLWSNDSGELYFRTDWPRDGGGRMMAVSIEATPNQPIVGSPRALFDGPYQGDGDIGPDGRFLLLRPTPPRSPSAVIQLIFNWFEELASKVPPPR